MIKNIILISIVICIIGYTNAGESIICKFSDVESCRNARYSSETTDGPCVSFDNYRRCLSVGECLSDKTQGAINRRMDTVEGCNYANKTTNTFEGCDYSYTVECEAKKDICLRSNTTTPEQKCNCFGGFYLCLARSGCREWLSNSDNKMGYKATRECSYLQCPFDKCSLGGEKQCPEFRYCNENEEPKQISATCRSCAPKCTREKLAACSTSIGECTPDEVPERDASCCPTCTPKQCPVAPNCTSWDALPLCSNDTTAFFNEITCCKLCKRPPLVEERPDQNGMCTRQAFEKCAVNKPFCVPGQNPLLNIVKDACCFGCIRPERRCNITDFVLCKKDRPDCAIHEKPAFYENECCAHCKLAKPKCEPACEGESKCFRGRNNIAVCKRPKIIKRKLKLLRAARKAAFDGMTDDEITTLLVEMVKRWCDKTDNEKRCAAHREKIENFVARIVKRVGDSVDIDIEMEEGPMFFMEGESAEKVLDAALNEEAQENGYEVEALQSTGSASSVSIFMAAVLVAFRMLF